jgi:hypothetical protein
LPNTRSTPIGFYQTSNQSGGGLVEPTPAFVLQQADELDDGSRVWIDIANLPFIAGGSNLVTIPSEPNKGRLFYRARQR